MAQILRSRPAPSGPGLEPRWTPSCKDGIGTAYSTQSRIWFTTAAGIVTEVYFPTIDRPQVRDLQLIVTDGASFFHDEKSVLRTTVSELEPHALGLAITNEDPGGRYKIVKELICDPHQPCFLMRVKIERAPTYTGPLRLFVLCAPHLEVSGYNNSGYVASRAGREFLVANKGPTWLALAADVPFKKRSCGYVGTSDGWQDLSKNFELTREYDCAEDGNVALVGELDISTRSELTLGLAFGDRLHHATSVLFQSLGVSFGHHRERFVDQWHRAGQDKLRPLAKHAQDGGRLYNRSHSYLVAHEDKTYPGALIASLSIPWGESKGDEELGGYHLVWTRDLVNSATGLLAAGDNWTPLRALIYLACLQREDGGFPQNSWIDGDAYWSGVQLDEVSFPILLAWRLHQEKALREFDPYEMVLRAAGFLVRNGPATQQERWEENAGFSPSTLAVNIAALVVAALFARVRGDEPTARFMERHADFLESHVDQWTVTRSGSLVPGIPRHFARILPREPSDPFGPEDLETAVLHLKNQPLGAPSDFPAKDVVDAGFLELVRHGVRAAGDPLIEDSLRVIDAVLKVEMPQGPCWRRYNHDGYGETALGLAYRGAGRGRAWPLLTGERAHYELAAGRDVRPLVRALERFASRGRLLPEQVWDEGDRPELGLIRGQPTGAAMPLMWAHAEYIKLLRSIDDGAVFDRVPAVAARYASRASRPKTHLEVWKLERQVPSVAPGTELRILGKSGFTLRWTRDDWAHATETASQRTAVGVDFVDVVFDPALRGPLKFTFRWSDGKWEGRDFSVAQRA